MSNEKWSGPTKAAEGMHPMLAKIAADCCAWPKWAEKVQLLTDDNDCNYLSFVEAGAKIHPHYPYFMEQDVTQARKDLGLENWQTSLTDTKEEAAALEDMVKASSAEVCNYPNCTCPIDKTTVCARGLPDAMTVEEEELPAREHQYSPYFKDVRHIDTLDVYRVIDLFGCEKHGHPISHAVKKLLLSGVRTGGKDLEKDVSEAIDSLIRWKEMREEDGNKN